VDVAASPSAARICGETAARAVSVNAATFNVILICDSSATCPVGPPSHGTDEPPNPEIQDNHVQI